MTEMSTLISQMSTTDTKKKLTVGENLISQLHSAKLNGEVGLSTQIGSFVDSLIDWMQSSNFKVAQNGIEIITILAEILRHKFRIYINTVIFCLVDRLGDSRETVRQKAHRAIEVLMVSVLDAQQILEKILPSFQHKNGKVREELLILLQRTVDNHHANNIMISRFIPAALQLMSDPMLPVRDAAHKTMMNIYMNYGERVRSTVIKSNVLPPAKVSAICAAFDQVKGSAPVKNEDDDDDVDARLGCEEVADGESLKKTKSRRSNSVPATRRQIPTLSTQKPPIAAQPSTAAAGAVTEESFIDVFNRVQPVEISSGKYLQDQLTKIKDMLNNPLNDWKARIDSLVLMRSLLEGGAAEFDEFNYNLKTLELPFITSIKDLRSQVVREACITVAFISLRLRLKVDRFIEALLQHIINLIQISTKVLATSGIVCLKSIIKNTHSPRFIPVLISNMHSKSKEIRRNCYDIMNIMLLAWPTQALEKHCVLLQDAIKKGITDADFHARKCSRKAFWGFSEHFKEQADILFNELDAPYRRMLQEGDRSTSSSSNSLNQACKCPMVVPAKTNIPSNIVANSITSTLTAPRKLSRQDSGLAKNTTSPLFDSSPRAIAQLCRGRRSNSAIDASAMRRANVRAQYAQRGRMGLLGTPSTRGSGSTSPIDGSVDSVGLNMAFMGSTTPRTVTRRRSSCSSREMSPQRLSFSSWMPHSNSMIQRQPEHYGRKLRHEEGSDESDASSISSEFSLISSRQGKDVFGVYGFDKDKLNKPFAKKSPSYKSLATNPIIESEALTPEDIHHSLRSTANAIQNYQFDSDLVASSNNNNYKSNSVGVGALHPSEYKVSPTSEERSHKVLGATALEDHNGLSEAMNCDVVDIISEIQNTEGKEHQKKMYFLYLLVKYGNGRHMHDIKTHSYIILKVLLQNLESDSSSTKISAFMVLKEMVQNPQIYSTFSPYYEQVTLEILKSQSDRNKTVDQWAEEITFQLAHIMPPDNVISVLSPIIKSGSFPMNHAALKMLKQFAELGSQNDSDGRIKNSVTNHLDELVSGLLKAYDNTNSVVRKAAVFCLVAMHQLVGQDLQPHLASLNRSKLKLLNLYIGRAQAMPAGRTSK